MTAQDFKNDVGYKFTVRLCRKGEARFGLCRPPVHEEDEPLVEVYDPRFPPRGALKSQMVLPAGVSQWGDCELGLMVMAWGMGEFLALKGQEQRVPLANGSPPPEMSMDPKTLGAVIAWVEWELGRAKRAEERDGP